LVRSLGGAGGHGVLLGGLGALLGARRRSWDGLGALMGGPEGLWKGLWGCLRGVLGHKQGGIGTLMT